MALRHFGCLETLEKQVSLPKLIDDRRVRKRIPDNVVSVSLGFGDVAAEMSHHVCIRKL